MENVLKKAGELGQAILESEAYTRMRLLEQQTAKDMRARELVAECAKKRAEVQDILCQNDYDRDALKRATEELEASEKVMGEYAPIAEMRAAGAEFKKMMDNVNRLIKFALTGETGEEGGCSGSCATCGGCSH